MTRIDFYIVDFDVPHARFRMACRLCDKAYQHQQEVYVHTETPAHAEIINDLLWTENEENFLPHGLISEETEAPIVIGHQQEVDSEAPILINLDLQVPLFFSQFHRVIEIVPRDDEQRRLVREHYRFYKERGYPVNTHEIKQNPFRK